MQKKRSTAFLMNIATQKTSPLKSYSVIEHVKRRAINELTRIGTVMRSPHHAYLLQ